MADNTGQEGTDVRLPLLQQEGAASAFYQPDAQQAQEGQAGEQDGEGSSGDEKGRIKWQPAALIILGDMFGVGLLSLPGDFVRLGWLPCIIWVVLIAAGDCFSGWMYTRLMTAVPRTPRLDDIGEAAYGKKGRRAVQWTVYTIVGATPCLLHLTTVTCLQQIFPHWSSHRLLLNFAVAIIMMPIAQIKGAAQIGSIAAVATAGMLGVIGILVVRLLAFPPDLPDGKGQTALVAKSGPMSALVALMDIVFLFTGQEIWVRYGSALRRRNQFVKAVTTAVIFSAAMFLATGVVTYAVLGDTIDMSAPITSSLPHDVWGIAMNASLLVHCLIHYQIILNVWIFLVLQTVNPDAAASLEPNDHSMTPDDYYSQHRHHRPAWHWFTASVVAVVFAAAVSYLLPFFSELMGFIAAVGNLSAMFLLPSIFCLKMVKMGKVPRMVCKVLIPVSVVLSVGGVVGSVHGLVQSLRG